MVETTVRPLSRSGPVPLDGLSRIGREVSQQWRRQLNHAREEEG